MVSKSYFAEISAFARLGPGTAGLRAERQLRAARPPLDCPIVAFGDREDPEVQRSQLEAWRQATRGAFRLR